MISISCGTCGKSFSVGADKAGRQVKCPCGAMMDVPGAVANQAGGHIPRAPSIVAGESSVVKAEINASQNVGQLAGDLVQNKTTSNTTNHQTVIIHNYHFHGHSGPNPAGSESPTITSNPRYLEIKIDDDTSIKLVLIPAGTFRMGSPETEFERSECEQLENRHRVKISRPFYLGKYPVTQSQWQSVMGKNPSCFKGANLPVETVSWDDAMLYCEELNQMTGLSFRLPTEAQWEYACRAGSANAFCFGDDQTKLGEYAWFANNTGNESLVASQVHDWIRLCANECRTHPVGEKKPNAWGLHDMHGNVWEWCSDVFGYYTNHGLTDPENLSPPSDRICRGGAWSTEAHQCRSAKRGWLNPQLRHCNYGLRLMLPVE